jgi:hypothetical protein
MKPASKAAGNRPARPKTLPYRGVQIQNTSGRSRFSVDQIRKAVEAALMKNADAIAGRR